MGVGKKLVLLAAISALLLCSSERSGVIILCAGDSMTDSEYPRHLSRLFRQEGRHVRVLNYGRKGNTSREYLRFLEDQKSALALMRPDFVLLQLGTNDVRVDGDFTSTEDFVVQMKAIIRIFHDLRNPGGGKTMVLLGLIPPIPEGVSFPFGPRSRERVRQEINPLLEKIAVEEGVVLVDNYSLFLTRPQLLAGIHPTSQGYKAMAQNWHTALKPLLGTP
jgi:lysophospholipase L1-like esterase